MGSIATFTSTYLIPTVLPSGDRQQLAGPVYKHAQFIAQGGVGTPAVNLRNRKIVYAAARDAISASPNLVADFFALDAT